MNYEGLLSQPARYFPQAYSLVPLIMSDVERYMNDHRFTHDELKIICPKTNDTDSYSHIDQPWREAYDPDCMEHLWSIGYSFIIHSPYVSKAVKDIARSIESANHSACDAHVYMGKKNSESFPPHADDSYNLIVQCEGETLWRVWDEETIDVVMSPGDAIYIPRGVSHQAQPLTDRVSVSFPFFPGPKTIQRDIRLE